MEIPEGAPRSEDGYYWWDGTQWRLVAQEANPDEDANALVTALREAGIEADPATIEDPATLREVVTALDTWYQGLNEVSRTVVDSLTEDGMAHLLTTDEVGVLAEGTAFLAALDTSGLTLGQTLAIATQALDSAAPGTSEQSAEEG